MRAENIGQKKRCRSAHEAIPVSYRDCYKIIECVGEGTYGVVSKATERATGNLVALKRIRTNGSSDGLPATSLREIKLLKNLDHPHIIKLNSVFHEPFMGGASGQCSESPILILEFDYLECDLRKFM
ncbi:protein kinase domain protein [Gregarina niphandrodes]|uniref:Cyclin-dependent kinase 2 homolog n=1 Tax=Gregarina niphandrodes TaxID=110365 RepID=A0A023B7P7_GRENI|nr:protein kinase domain protein [Gregarina niphandrodes]EZG67533.1 protein kinase domain protein [Gregarina niphandrodes]|eukprot:XP_011130210.1 protein kinase domain protein [Gregarina niphandrodes]